MSLIELSMLEYKKGLSKAKNIIVLKQLGRNDGIENGRKLNLILLWHKHFD